MNGLEYAGYKLDGKPVAWNANQVRAWLRDRYNETVQPDYQWHYADEFNDYEGEQEAPSFWTAQLLALEGVN